MEDLIDIYHKVNQFGRDNGMKLTIKSPGNIHYEMEVLEKHLATKTTIHGGMIAAMMDGVLGVAALTAVVKDRRLVSTVEFKINYYQPAFLGDKLKGIGKVDFQGKRILSASGEIYNQNDELVAKALGTFNAYPAEKSDIFEFLSSKKI